MSTSTSYDHAPDFTLKVAQASVGKTLFATMRAVAEGMRDGLAAERRYHGLTARGVPHAEAVARVFEEHYA
jgi:hypothetical protein